MRQSTGHVRIYSELGHGTTVKLYLPRLTGGADEAGAARREPVGATVRGEGETILVVEDEDALRTFTGEALRDLGYRVVEARDAATALTLLETEPDLALLFTDVVLPGGMSGRALSEELLRRRPGTPVLLTTGYTLNAALHHGRLDAGVHLIGKPFGYAELAAKVRMLVEARQP